MKDADKEWGTAYVAEATELSDTLGSSTGAQTEIDIRRASKLLIQVAALTLAVATKITVYLQIGDDAATPVYVGYAKDLGGTNFGIPVASVGTLPAWPVDGRHAKLDVIADVAGTDTTCTLKYLRIYDDE